MIRKKIGIAATGLILAIGGQSSHAASAEATQYANDLASCAGTAFASNTLAPRKYQPKQARYDLSAARTILGGGSDAQLKVLFNEGYRDGAEGVAQLISKAETDPDPNNKRAYTTRSTSLGNICKSKKLKMTQTLYSELAPYSNQHVQQFWVQNLDSWISK